jgi:phosphoglycolate phosphatase
MDAPFPNTIRAVLFDLDGTLLDTLEDLGNSTNSVLARQGFPVHALPAYKQFVGEGITVLVRKALPAEKSEDEGLVSRCVAELSAEYTAHCMDATDAYPGIQDLLATLQLRHVAMAVLSNKPDAMVQMLLKKYFPSISFTLAAGANEFFPRKPDPTAAIAFARKIDIPPEQWAFLGDSKIDMQTAKAADMFPVGALWGFRDAAELLANGAKKLIKQPGELLEIVRG